jgi:hypothetical protein
MTNADVLIGINTTCLTKKTQDDLKGLSELSQTIMTQFRKSIYKYQRYFRWKNKKQIKGVVTNFKISGDFKTNIRFKSRRGKTVKKSERYDANGIMKGFRLWQRNNALLNDASKITNLQRATELIKDARPCPTRYANISSHSKKMLTTRPNRY